MPNDTPDQAGHTSEPAPSTSGPAASTADQAPDPSEKASSSPREPADDLVVTSHQIETPDGLLHYTAQTGRVVLHEEVLEDGKFSGSQPRAEMFCTAYTLDGADPGTRPVTFAFNGGPGSSSVWLHLGLLGPRRVVMGDVGALVGPPYGLTDNAETLLRVSDLVFIDPVTTGYSRSISGRPAGDYHGFTRDLESVGELIRLWTSRNGRWLSPKFLAGESYGTTRAAALADHLADRCGMYVNGLLLISSVLDLGSVHFSEGNDLPFSLYLPTYTAAAHYHGVISGDLRERVAEAEAFAAGDLARALAEGSRLSGAERADVVARYAALTGLNPDYVDRADLRVDLFAFAAELLRSRRALAGRLDLRFTGWFEDANEARMSDYDPALVAITGPYAAALNAYVRGELGYASDLTYNLLTPKVQPWSYSEFEGRSVSVATRLTHAMRANPHLRVHVACGYYDGATPHFAAEHVFAHLRLPEEARQRIEFTYYEAGHMMYVHEPSRLRQAADLADFIRRAS